MIRLVFADPKDFSRDELMSAFSCSELSQVLQKGKNKRQNLIRATAYFTLKSAYSLLYISPLPTVLKDGYSRPYLCSDSYGRKNVPTIGISHTDDLVLISFSDEDKKIGIDLECERAVGNSEALYEKYLVYVNNTLHNPDFNFEACFLKTDKYNNKRLEKFTDFTGVSTIPCNFFASWTAFESVLKADGRGYSAIPDKSIFLKSETASFEFDYNNKRYYFSLART